jgi:hypothetical protein
MRRVGARSAFWRGCGGTRLYFGWSCGERLATQRCVCGGGSRGVELEDDVMRRAGARSAF